MGEGKAMRRRDKELTEQSEIRSVLEACRIGQLALA